MTLQKINRLFEDINFSNVENLHLIAISNLNDSKRRVERWWEKKFRKPIREFQDHTEEELYVAYLEDFYDNNPSEIERFLDSLKTKDEPVWDGKTSQEHEAQMQKIWKKKRQIDLSQFKSDIELSEEEEKAIIDNLGRNLKKTVVVKNKEVEEEFDDSFLGV